MIIPENLLVTAVISNKMHYKKSKLFHVEARHMHTLSFRISGEKRILLENSRKPLISDADTITYIPHGTTYDEETTEDGQMLAVHFDLAEEAATEAFVFRPASPIAYRNLFDKMVESYRVGTERDYHCLALLYEIFSMLRHEALRSTQQAVPRRLRTALHRINSEFADPELSVGAIAREAGISEVYFRQEFKQYIGVAPREYICRVRLENAQALLGTAVYPVSEVAIRCGFNSISYFSSQFKRMYGISPLEYMKKAPLKNNSPAP